MIKVPELLVEGGGQRAPPRVHLTIRDEWRMGTGDWQLRNNYCKWGSGVGTTPGHPLFWPSGWHAMVL